MNYAAPEVEVIGTGSELVQAFVGPFTDFGAYSLSLGFPASSLNED